jgi:peptide deformylase
MPAKKPLPKLLPVDLYDLTAADKKRFKEEMSLGMVSPQDPRLKQPSQPIDVLAISTPRVQEIVQRVLNAADRQQQGNVRNRERRTLVGLAAPQIGENLRIIVVDTKIKPDRKKPGKLECFINPEIIWRSRETEEGREGCFSAGSVWGLVRRPVAVKIRAYTPEGKQIERIFEDFTARIMQHEIDHLNGLRFADRITSDRKRHWVHTEEIALYSDNIHRWPRLCSRERWETFTTDKTT